MTSQRRSDLDEDDVRIRPGRGKSRPRSKDRPAHEDAVAGFVCAVDRGRFTVVIGDPTYVPPDADAVEIPIVHAIKSRELGRKSVLVGDRVDLTGDISGGPDAKARIVRIAERSGVLRRSADDIDPVERALVANTTQLCIVVAVTNPEPRPRLIDRFLVAAFDAGIRPFLAVTKADIADPDVLARTYEALDIPLIVVRREANPLELQQRLRGQITVLVGASGVGKSTLVNRLVPGADRTTGHVNAVTGRGRHTSTSAVLLQLPSGGWIVDTPGLRSFGLAHVDPTRVVAAFPDLADGTADCPRGCSHDEPECALDEFAAAEGPGSVARLDSLRRLLRSRTSGS